MFNSDISELIAVNKKFIKIYEQAIKNIGINEINGFLEQFYFLNKKHLNELINFCKKLNNEFNQIKNEGALNSLELQAIKNNIGTKEAVIITHSNQRKIIGYYQKVVSLDSLASIKDLLQNHLAKLHSQMEYLDKLIAAKPWSNQDAPSS